jgi:N-acetyl-gamma-glutamyl-phosphate reductase
VSVRCVIVGAAGYTGAELVTILLHHPEASIVGLFGSAQRAAGSPTRLSDLFPRFRGRLDDDVLAYEALAVAALKPDVVFLATPHEASVGIAAALHGRGLRVFDLSGAFRLPSEMYPQYYGFDHTEPELLSDAVYGMCELNRERLVGASMVAVPGCYPTSVILPVSPLVRAGAVRDGSAVIVDSVSGMSGAGRGANVANLFCEVSMRPYGVLTHRHQPEMAAHAGVRVVFTPHVGPYERGLVSTIHVELADGFDAQRVGDVMGRAYEGEAFIRLLPRGTWPSVGGVVHTNYCDIAWAVDEEHGHLIVCSAIDNLVKGASGQAVQCMNIALGLEETAGLVDQPRHTKPSPVGYA